MIRKSFHVFGVALVASACFVGCNKSTETSNTATDPQKENGEGHVHGEWWCSEHGVPEEICAQCEPDVAADFKAKGDWCKEHDRPDSQCFICHPEKEAEFAAQYEAKYGEKPPKPEAGEDGHEHSDEHEEEHEEENS